MVDDTGEETISRGKDRGFWYANNCKLLAIDKKEILMSTLRVLRDILFRPDPEAAMFI